MSAYKPSAAAGTRLDQGEQDEMVRPWRGGITKPAIGEAIALASDALTEKTARACKRVA